MAEPNTLTSRITSDQLGALAQKEALSLVIVDSGMGGLAICAGIVDGLVQQGHFKQVEVTYFNAWPERNRGYNALRDSDECIRAFDAALTGMQAFVPDMVLIACNTLSVIYPQTAFSRCAHMPVVGIVDFGVDLILRHLVRQPDSQVIILGTLTTIAAGIHRDTLIANGIDGRRIVSQACDQLATEIEKGPDSPMVHAMIDDFVVQAASKLNYPNASVSAAFCCTHYGYSRAYFKKSLETYTGSSTKVLNPNKAMEAYLLSLFNKDCFPETALGLTVVSRIQWSRRKVAAIVNALKPVSPFTAQALLNYRYDPELFSF